MYVPVVLTEAEAEELCRYTWHGYVNANTYPALARLIERLCDRYQPDVVPAPTGPRPFILS